MLKDLLLCCFDLLMSDAARIMLICVAAQDTAMMGQVGFLAMQDVIAGLFWARVEHIRKAQLGVIH